jgi:serine protease
VYAAGGAIAPGPRLGFSPRALDFGHYAQALDLQLRNAGNGTLTVTSVEAESDFLTVTPIDVAASGLGTYRVFIDRQGMPHSAFKGSLLVHTSVGDQSVTVVGDNYDGGSEPDGGREYIAAIDATTGEVVSTLPILATGFFISFRFDDVPPGHYILRSGTDLNNDGDTCDPGELCGAYPNPDLPDAIDNTEPLTGIEIPIKITAMPPAGSSQ